MDEKDLLFLKTLYEKKNLTLTAKTLYVSQPALTGRLHQLEQDFGCRIVLRRPRGIEFSTEGETLVHFADETLQRLQETRERIRSMQENIAGSLHIGCSNLYAKYELPVLLRQFHEQAPGVEIQLHTGHSEKIYQQLLNGSLQLGIIRGDYHWPGRQQLLNDDTYYAVSAAPFTLDDLPELPCIHYDTDAPLQLELDNWWFSHFSRPANISLQVDSVDTCLQMVQQGLGFALLSGLGLKNTPDLCKQKLLYKDGTPLIRSTWLYYYASSLQIRTVQAFVDFLQK